MIEISSKNYKGENVDVYRLTNTPIINSSNVQIIELFYYEPNFIETKDEVWEELENGWNKQHYHIDPNVCILVNPSKEKAVSLVTTKGGRDGIIAYDFSRNN